MTRAYPLLTRQGAEHLAHRLQTYWHQRGYEISAEVVAEDRLDREIIWAVRTNLRNGQPPSDSGCTGK